MEEEHKEQMQSEDIGKLAEALSKAQSEMEGAKKDANNPFFKKDYSTLFATWEACRHQLTKNGLSIIQTTGGNGSGIVTVYTILAHSSGQWVKSALSIKPEKPGPQALGSCLTYLRRYSLAGVVGLSPLDDDAEAAMVRKPTPTPTKTPAKASKSNDKAKTPYDEYMDSMKEAKMYLKALTGSNDGYSEVLKVYGISHANEMKDMKQGKELLKYLRRFAASEAKRIKDDKNTTASETPGHDGDTFPPSES